MFSGRASSLFISIIIILLLQAPTVLFSEVRSSQWLTQYEELRDAVYNSEMGEQKILGMYNNAITALENVEDSTANRSYFAALTSYIVGRYYLNNVENKEKAAKFFEEALEKNEEWKQKTGEISEYLRLKSEVTSQLCLVKPLGFILKNGPEVTKLARKALELDPNNGKAAIQIASAKVYPPRIYGGNPRKGLKLLTQVMNMPALEKDDLFNIYSGMGLSHLRLKEYDESALWLEKALSLYPENKYCLQLYRDAQNRDAGINEKRMEEMRREKEREKG